MVKRHLGTPSSHNDVARCNVMNVILHWLCDLSTLLIEILRLHIADTILLLLGRLASLSGRTGTSSDQMERREESRRNEVCDETARFGFIHPVDRSKRENERSTQD